jgi:Ca2+ transporting ATPase
MERSFLHSPAEVLEHFGVSERAGLSQDQVLKSRQKYGPNGQYSPTSTLSAQSDPS